MRGIQRTSDIKRIRKICMDLGRITGIRIEYFMSLTLDELCEAGQEIAEEVSGHRGEKK